MYNLFIYMFIIAGQPSYFNDAGPGVIFHSILIDSILCLIDCILYFDALSNDIYFSYHNATCYI